MDAKLAEVYGTNKPDETDVEALATAELATKLAAADQVDLEGLSDEEAESLAAQIIGSDADDTSEKEDEEKEEKSEEPQEEETKEAQEKIAEADYLGRVMAHAYVNERREIEKEAGKMDNLKGAASAAGKKAKETGGKVLSHLGSHKKKYMGGAAAAAAGGFAASKMKKKAASAEPEQVSALDQLALARAKEILKENGFEDAPQEQEKKSSVSEEKAALLEQKVQERAVQMLVDAGYTFEEGEKTEE